MTQALTTKQPLVVAGLAVLVFSGIVAIEGLLLRSLPELLLAVFLAVLGWRLHRRGLRLMEQVDTTSSVQVRCRWLRFCLIALPTVLGAYLLGYLLLMDRHLPTYPRDRHGRFESSFRWAGLEPRPHKVPETTSWPFPNVTIWNLIYRPMDALYFQFRPRPVAEIESLRQKGWSW